MSGLPSTADNGRTSALVDTRLIAGERAAALERRRRRARSLFVEFAPLSEEARADGGNESALLKSVKKADGRRERRPFSFGASSEAVLEKSDNEVVVDGPETLVTHL
jgi:hypothetical protein